MVQPSTYCRSGLEPMKAQHSMARPVRWAISTIGTMSATTVRAAQLARTRSRASAISRASRSASRATCGPAPGRPMSAVSTPIASIRCRMRIFSSIAGVRTEGDCSPSRSVSSSSCGGGSAGRASRFQS
jgi:hypothetical protein